MGVGPVVGGRQYEDWGEGVGQLYGHIIHYDPPRQQVVVLTGGLDEWMYTARNTDVVEPDGDGAIYKKSLLLAGEVPATLETIFRSGAGGLGQALKTYLEKETPR